MICLKKKEKKEPTIPQSTSFFWSWIKKTQYAQNPWHPMSHQARFCVCVRILLLHEGSWKSDSKHQTGKQPPARTDRLMFVCISPATIFLSVLQCVISCMCLRNIYYLTLQVFTIPQAAKTGFKALFVLRLHRKAAFLNSLQANGSLSSLSASC